MSSTFSTNIKGKVKEVKIPLDKAIFSVYEAISNSMHAISDILDIRQGIININFIREEVIQGEIGKSKEDLRLKVPIKSIEIQDNGIGFNDENFQSFMTCNSDYKLKIGGKGVGRFTWLKVFKNVKVDSIYKNNGISNKLSFNFLPQNELEDEDKYVYDGETGTSILLNEMFSTYQAQFPLRIKLVAELIIEHFLINFISGKMPIINLNDEIDGSLCVNDYFKESNVYESTYKTFKIFNSKFDIYHIKSINANNANKCFLTANYRAVDKVDLSKYIENLQNSISKQEDKKVWYSSYVSSEYFDTIVNSERTELKYPQKDSTIPGLDNISKDSFVNELINQTKLFLKDDLEAIEKSKINFIDHYINTKKPNYRKLREYRPEFYKNISNDISEDKLELVLFKEKQAWEKDIQESAKKLYDNSKKMDLDQLNQLKQHYLNNISAMGKDSLADYIVKRRSLLDMLDNIMSIDYEGKYGLEDAVHTLIYPMRTTSDKLEYDEMNLWLIDEKLSYHYYLASDTTMKSHKPINVASTKEMDIAIYNTPFLLNDTPEGMPFTTLTIVEFKRPMRNGYSIDENPIKQVYDYIRKIRGGTAKDRRGKLITGNLQDIPIFVYIVADIDNTLESEAINAGLRKTPDNEGFFGYNESLKAYVEITNYNKLKRDAILRNRVLFDKLFSPSVD